MMAFSKSSICIIMGAVYKIFPGVVLLLFSHIVFGQQLRLGKNPYAVEKSAVLELYSDNQGLLLPRIADTSLINILSPPDGMIIYFNPSHQMLVRANGHWQSFAMTGSVVTSLNGNTGALTMDTSYIGNFYLKGQKSCILLLCRLFIIRQQGHRNNTGILHLQMAI